MISSFSSIVLWILPQIKQCEFDSVGYWSTSYRFYKNNSTNNFTRLFRRSKSREVPFHILSFLVIVQLNSTKER